MSPLLRRSHPVRLATAAVLGLALAGVGACGGPSGPGASEVTTGPDTTATLPNAAATPPDTTATLPDAAATPPDTTALPTLEGSLFFIGTGSANGGLWRLRDGVLARVIVNDSYEFFQYATVSKDGSRVAWISPSSQRLRVQTIGGTAADVGPVISGDYRPQWSVNNSAILVATPDNHTIQYLNLPSGTTDPFVSQSACCFGVADADFNGIVHDRFAGTPPRVIDQDGSINFTMAEPSGQFYSRVQSLYGWNDLGIVLLQPDGSPGGDAGRVTAANAIVHLRTGETVPVPGGGELTGGFFIYEEAILRVDEGGADKVRLWYPNVGRIDAEITLPPAAADLALIWWAD